MDTVDIIAVVLGAVTVIVLPLLGKKWQRAKKVIKTVSDALEDDTLTADEIRAIIAAALGK